MFVANFCLDGRLVTGMTMIAFLAAFAAITILMVLLENGITSSKPQHMQILLSHVSCCTAVSIHQ